MIGFLKNNLRSISIMQLSRGATWCRTNNKPRQTIIFIIKPYYIMNKTLTVALSMCAGVAIVGAGVFAQSGMWLTSTATDSSVSNIWTKVRQGVSRTMDRAQITDEQKAEMKANREAVKSAIEANDYVAFQTAVAGIEKGKFADKEVSAEQFAQMVAMHETKGVHRAVVESAVKANDFAAFVTAHEEMKTTMEANRPTDASDRKGNRPELSDTEQTEKLQERFDNLVTYYAENGELPTMDNWHGKGKKGRGWHKMWMKRGDHGIWWDHAEFDNDSDLETNDD